MMEKPRHSVLMFWGYLHSNGKIQVKRWFWDVKDYTTDCEGNEFVVRVVPPFEASSREQAADIIKFQLDAYYMRLCHKLTGNLYENSQKIL